MDALIRLFGFMMLLGATVCVAAFIVACYEALRTKVTK